ncbi:hypothetical protein ACO0QE_000227 [Hanseniaspora vineae]
MFKKSFKPLRTFRWYSPPRIPKTQFNQSQYGTSFTNSASSSNTNDLSFINKAMQSRIFTEPTIVIRREIEMMNLFLGYEQVNKYSVCDVEGYEIGRIDEDDSLGGRGFLNLINRQLLRTRRPFSLDIWDHAMPGVKLGSVNRGFKFINSHVQCHIGNTASNDIVAGVSRQVWAPLRRKYDLYAVESPVTNTLGQEQTDLSQFGAINTMFLGWDFRVQDQQGLVIGGCDRSFGGFGREIFTDTGIYILRMDSQQSFNGVEDPQRMNFNKILNFYERCALIANCISIDFDYFSRHSGPNGLVSTSSYE